MLEPFIDWYVSRLVRQQGVRPAPTTLKGKRSRLRTAMSNTSTDNLEMLARTLTSRDEAERLLDRLYAAMSPGAVQLIVRACLDVGEWAQARGIISEPLALSMKDCPHGNPPAAVNVYSEAETNVLVGAARGVSLRWWAYLATVAATGRRASEVLKLEWSWLRLDATPPHAVLPTTKARKPQYVPLSRALVAEVFTPANVVFLSSRKDGGRYEGDPAVRPFPYHYQTVYNMFRRLCRVTGIEHRGLHCFRHSLATRLLGNGTPAHAVAALLGNSEHVLTRTYDQTLSLTYARYLES